MSVAKTTLHALFAGALSLCAPALRAGEGHDHAKHDHSKHDHPKHDHAAHGHGNHGHAHAAAPAGTPMSSHDGMANLYKHLGEMEKELSAGSLDGIHGHDEAIQAAVKDLDKDTTLQEARKKRVQGYVKNVQRLSGKMHASADAKKLDQVKADFGKLKAQVDLLDKQFAHSHKPGSGKLEPGVAKHPHHPHPSDTGK